MQSPLKRKIFLGVFHELVYSFQAWNLIVLSLQLGANYSGSAVGGHDVGQHSVAARHSTMLGGSQEVEVAGYRAHSSTAAQYGGQYSSVYGSAALSSAPQVSVLCHLCVIGEHFYLKYKNVIGVMWKLLGLSTFFLD